MKVQLSESEDMTKDTWVALESLKFSTVHFIVLCDLVPRGLGQLMQFQQPKIEEEKKDDLASLLINTKNSNKTNKAYQIEKNTQQVGSQAMSEFGMDFYKNITAGRMIKLTELDENTNIFCKQSKHDVKFYETLSYT